MVVPTRTCPHAHMLTCCTRLSAGFRQVVRQTIDPEAKVAFKKNTEDDPHMRKPDITKATSRLGWEPKVALREGLPLMVEDFRKRIFGDQKQVA